MADEITPAHPPAPAPVDSVLYDILAAENKICDKLDLMNDRLLNVIKKLERQIPVNVKAVVDEPQKNI